MKQATWDGDREHQGSLSWSATIQKAGIGEIWPGWTAISKRPGRRTKRLHITSSGPEHQHPSKRRTFNMATTLRRIQRLEADFRRYHRELDQQELRKKYDRSERISRKSLEYSEKQMDEVQEQLDYWKKVVAEHEDQGLKVWGPDDFSVGQRILAHGRLPS